MKALVLARWAGPLVVIAALVAVSPTVATAAPSTAIYTTTFLDATTYQNEFIGSDGKRHWTVDAGADSFPDDFYERPVMGGFETIDGKFATKDDYFGSIDIVQAHAGFDSSYLYFAIEMHDTRRHKSNVGDYDNEGLNHDYRVRISNEANGDHGYMLSVHQPVVNLNDFGYDWRLERNTVYHDINGDFAIDGNGYETDIIIDGMFKGTTDPVVYSRIAPGGDDNIVEFAIDYQALGFTVSDLLNLPYLTFESNSTGSSSSSSTGDKYIWNQNYDPIDVGSPYNTDPAYGTEGLKDIKEMDTLNGGAITMIPTPAALPAGLALIALLGLTGRAAATTSLEGQFQIKRPAEHGVPYPQPRRADCRPAFHLPMVADKPEGRSMTYPAPLPEIAHQKGSRHPTLFPPPDQSMAMWLTKDMLRLHPVGKRGGGGCRRSSA